MTALFLDTMTLKGTPLHAQLAAAAGAGFAGVRIRGNDLREFERTGGCAAGLKALLDEMDLASPAFVPEADVYDWHYADRASEDFCQRMTRAIADAVGLGARCALFPVMSTKGALETLLDNFKWLCAAGAERDLRIGLEFIGHVPKVPDIATAWEIVRRANHPYGGVVIDLFHYYRGGSRLADLREVPGEKIFVVDLDDAMDLPMADLLGYRHRLYPGRGVAPVRDVVGVLESKGFAGPYCVELFNESYWAAAPDDVARLAFESASSVLQQGMGA